MKYQLANMCTLLVIFSLLLSCQKDVFVPAAESGEGLDDWTTETHSNSASPNYDIVFNQTTVNRIDIVLSSDEYQTMQTDLASLVGSTGGGQGGPLGGGGGQVISSDENPVYVAADFYFNGVQWYNVGLRYKGNSSLQSAFSQGIGKLPFRLKFDKFEDEYPEINNQRFYGFKDLSLSSNYNDKSLMREKNAPDLFREFGVAAPQTAYYEMWVDEGNGTAKYYGLYTMVEVIFDTMLNDQFGSESGNCYKPENSGAKFSASGFSLDDFEKKTNEDDADWSDIQNMYDALHASTRTTDIEQWKTDLEAVFYVDGFLKYLAVNNTIQNWDTYGKMEHNYYLYHDPADDLIKWIPWDNNEAFSSTGPQNPLSFEMNEVSDEWPLISYIVDVPEYRAIYDAYITELIAGAFEASKMDAQFSSQDDLISASATSEVSGYSFLNGSGDYLSAVATIKTHCETRNIEAADYLD